MCTISSSTPPTPALLEQQGANLYLAAGSLNVTSVLRSKRLGGGAAYMALNTVRCQSNENLPQTESSRTAGFLLTFRLSSTEGMEGYARLLATKPAFLLSILPCRGSCLSCAGAYHLTGDDFRQFLKPNLGGEVSFGLCLPHFFATTGREVLVVLDF